MIKKILIGLAAVIAILLIVAATRPADFRVERSATLSASPAALFSSSYALRFENNSLRQVRIGGMEPAMTEQRVEFVVLIFPHGTLTR